MKNKITISKTIKAAILLALILCQGLKQAANAQPYLITPTNQYDQFWYTTNNPIQGINASTINWATPSSAPECISASAYYDGTNYPTIYVMDAVAGSGASITSSGAMASVPDLILGNTGGSLSPSGTNYILAVAYVNSGGLVQIDYYDITDNGSSVSISVDPTPTTIITGTYYPAVVHLHIIAEGGQSPTAYSYCSRFVVTWDDPTGTGYVYAWNFDLNSLVSSFALSSAQNCGSGISPDVAAIQRIILPGVDNIALLTYTDAASATLYYQEWDITTASLSLPVVLDQSSVSYPLNSITLPRIDAPGSYIVSYSPLNSNYKVVAQVDSSASHWKVVRSYDNLTLSSVPPFFSSSDVIDISGLGGIYSTYHPLYNNYAPTVAFAEGDYDVLHFMEYATGHDALFMEPELLSSPITLNNNDYYWVNSYCSGGSLPVITDAAPCSFANAVSGAVNGTRNMIYTWAFYNGNSYEVDYKTFIPPSTPYAFRQGAPGAAIANAPAKAWQVFPNPAIGELWVSYATGGSAAMAYSITDMAGQALLHGALATANAAIDVSRLAAGAYIIKVYADGKDNGQQLFVKE